MVTRHEAERIRAEVVHAGATGFVCGLVVGLVAGGVLVAACVGRWLL